MNLNFHSSPQFPQLTTVPHGNCEHPSHHTTTVVAVGCGECVVETVAHVLAVSTVHGFPQSTVTQGAAS
jgi:hypothetical protein